MAFPLSPANNQTTLVNGIVYQYNTTLGVWKRNGSLASINVSQILVTSSQASTSNTSGALLVTGGAGISGNIYTGGIFITGSSNVLTFADGTRQTTASVQGASGISGATGAGVQGASGATGAAGSQGASGSAGTNGATGSAGANGATGPTGTNGTNGATGSQGTQGASGIPKTTTSATAPTSPIVGDMWYDSDSDVLLRYTNDGTTNYWIDISGPSFDRSTYIRQTYLITANVS